MQSLHPVARSSCARRRTCACSITGSYSPPLDPILCDGLKSLKWTYSSLHWQNSKKSHCKAWALTQKGAKVDPKKWWVLLENVWWLLSYNSHTISGKWREKRMYMVDIVHYPHTMALQKPLTGHAGASKKSHKLEVASAAPLNALQPCNWCNFAALQ